MTDHPNSPSPSGPLPPPGCPAHAHGTADGRQRIYGPEAEPLGPLLERLRAEYGEVAPVLVPGDIPAWLVLGYNAVRDVSVSSSRAVCDSRHGRVYQQGLVPEDSPLRPMTEYKPLAPFVDGEPLARLRSAVIDGLDFNRHSLRRYITRYADRLIDDFASRRTADLVTEYAAQLPALVLAWMYGLPEEESPALVDAVRDLTSGSERAAEGNAFVTRTMQELLRRRKSGQTVSTTFGGRDFVSRLLAHESHLTDDEVVEHLRLVFVAGYTPTVALIANTVVQILTQRQFSRNLTSGQMTLPEALNRVLWDDPPIGLLPTRWAAGDMVVGEQRIPSGEMIVLGIEAANADPTAREPGTPVPHSEAHLAFGAGPHECPGRDIGMAIAEIGIETLLTRLEELELTVTQGELRWQSAWVSQRLEELPVRFSAVQQAARKGTGRPAAAASTDSQAPEAATDRQPDSRTRKRSLLRR
ncbi:cytochrome P450 [Streptomyces sp. NPDC048644]|uniref:cytochrome P450 n=1 Tax=Streptomyces sp. NPDC048644 TaxID=3365582 RepID=UPI00371B3924